MFIRWCKNCKLSLSCSSLMEKVFLNEQKQPPIGVLKKKCSENTQQIYRRTPMPKSDFNKVAKQIYWNNTLAWVFSCKVAMFSKHFFLRAPLDGCFCIKQAGIASLIAARSFSTILGILMMKQLFLQIWKRRILSNFFNF